MNMSSIRSSVATRTKIAGPSRLRVFDKMPFETQGRPALRLADCRQCRWVLLALMICMVALGSASALRADDPFPRTRDYDLQNVRVHLRFDTDNKKVIGEVTHSISVLRPNVSELKFDSVALTIESVTLDGKAAKIKRLPIN